ncbi:MAG: hypothetical protein RIS44_1017 [Pseudomonadota bacterium]
MLDTLGGSLNQTLLSTAQRWAAQGLQAIVIEVTRIQGSVPRETGTRMLVSRDDVAGTIGGGHLEWQAMALARGLLEASSTSSIPQTQRYPLGPSLGQCCGGVVELKFEHLTPALLQDWQQAPPRFHLQLYGAGHVGRAIAHVLSTLNVQVLWVDERESAFPSNLPEHIRVLAVDAPETEVQQAPPRAFYLVVTHQHALDLRITEAILRRGDFGYLGLIGSATKRARFVHQLEARGVSSALLQRMICPIGLPGIEGKEPEVIAVAAVGQMLLHRGAVDSK